jgi:hypothetical protein
MLMVTSSLAKACIKTRVLKRRLMGYRTRFEASGIRHSNMGFRITPCMYIAGYFMLLFDLTPDHGAAGHFTS